MTPRSGDPRAPGDDRVGDPHDDRAADRRTMLVAALAVIGLVLVGVTSAAVFTRSACGVIDPDPVPLGVGGTDPGPVLAEAFPGTDDASRDGMTATLTALAGELGPLTGIAEVTGSDGLAATPGGIAATGPVTTLLDADGATARVRVDLGDGRAVGAGDTLYSLAVGNELTGQVDAVLPLGDRLEPRTCVDTATIGTPLAFHLDAAGGELLLLRVEEDGSDPELELRDPVAGRVWGPRLELGTAQPGLLGERLTGGLGPTVAVAGLRTAPDADVPVLTAVDRGDGGIRWTRSREDVGAIRTNVPELVEVLAVDENRVVVAFTPDPAADDGDAVAAPDGGDPTAGGDASAVEPGAGARVGVFDLDDGRLAWEVELDVGEYATTASTGRELVSLVVRGADGLVRVERLDGNGERLGSGGLEGTDGRVVTLGGGRALMVTSGGVVVAGDDVEVIATDLIGRDVVVHDGGVSLLFDGPEGGTIVTTFRT